MGELWYKNVNYEDAKELVKENLTNTVTSFIAAGFWLKNIRDGQEYLKDGYETIWECAEAEFGLKVSEASRAMSMNDKYSLDGNTPFVNDKYKNYNKSQLQEMLTLSEERLEQVTPDMTVTEIRDIKRAEMGSMKEQQNRAEWQQEQLTQWIECFVEEKYDILNRIYNLIGNFYLDTLMAELGEEISVGGKCSIMLNDTEAEFCDEETGEIFGKCNIEELLYRITGSFLTIRQRKCICDIANDAVITESKKDFEEELQEEFQNEIEEEILTEIEFAPEEEEELNVEFDTVELEKELDEIIDAEYREVEKTVVEPISTVRVPEYVEELENKQPMLPKMKNNAERKDWLEDVEAWGLWYEDSNIQARYYKYDFIDGSRLIAVKYKYSCPPWLEDEKYRLEEGTYKKTYYHMIYGEEYKKAHKYEYEKYYTNTTTSISALMEFIKELGKAA